MKKLPNPCLMLLTDRTKLTPNWTLAQAIAPAITGGCNCVVLRETDLPANHRQTVAGFVKDGVKGRVPWVIADDAALASRVGADGVHLSSLETLAAEGPGPNSLVGVSVRGREEALQAAAAGVRYLLVEYEWSNPAAVLAHFRALREGLDVSIIIGVDMPVEQVPDCLAAGATGVAICAPPMSAYDRTSACRAYAHAMGK